MNTSSYPHLAFCLLSLLLLTGNQARSQEASADFLAEGKFGAHLILNHSNIGTHATEITNWVNNQSAAFCEKITDSQASWVMVSIGSNSGLYCTPNATYEGFVGDTRATTTQDVPLILYNNLNASGVKVMIRFGLDGPSANNAWGNAMGWNYANETLPAFINGSPTNAYVTKLAQVLTVWGNRYGDKLAGWWFDHAYPSLGWTNAQFDTINTAARAGNPNRIVTFNDTFGAHRYTEHDDYTAGEMPLFYQTPVSQFTGGAQWHALSYIGTSWGSDDVTEYNDAVSDWLLDVTARSGAVTLNVNQNFGNKPAQYHQMFALGTALKGRPPESFKRYAFQNKWNAQALRVGSATEGAAITRANRTRDNYRLFVPVWLGSGLWRIKNEQSQKFIAPLNFSTSSTSVRQYTWNDAQPTMKWQLVHEGDGWFRIKNSASTGYLTADDDTTAIRVENWQSLDRQRWRLVSMDFGDAP